MSPRKQRKSKLPARLTDQPDASQTDQTKRKVTDQPDASQTDQTKRKVRQKRATNSAPTSSASAKSKGANQGVREDAKFIVGIDFGTTYSGFSYASMEDPETICTFENWPGKGDAGAFKYGKTQTSLKYLPGKNVGTFELQGWGWPAYLSHCQESEQKSLNPTTNTSNSASRSSSSLYFTNFKLHLADGASSNYTHKCKQEKPPDGLSAERFISDYLRELSNFAMEELKNRFGNFVQKKDVKWCLTVPTIWTDSAKHTMRVCSEMGGLVHGPQCQDSDASLQENFAIVLEPEAASVYCLQKLKNTHNLKMGSKVLVVDAGGGTVDLVVHELLDDSGLRVKEVTSSTGDLCGGTFVDEAFKSYLARQIGCFRTFCAQQPASMLDILGKCEGLKYSFDKYGQQRHVLSLPSKLARSWEAYEVDRELWEEDAQYDEVVITREDLKAIFDGQVNTILKLVKDQLALVRKVEAIFVVGGFSNSPYLMERIRAEFLRSVPNITSPFDAGSAVSQGAAIIGTLGVDIVMSRKSRKTYGVSIFRPFRKGDPAGSNINDDNGEALCRDAFDVFTRIGEDVPFNHCVRRQYGPFSKSHNTITFTMFSTSDPEPAYVTDKGVERVSSWTYKLPMEAQQMKQDPSVQVSMFFGRTQIQVSAEPMNFGGGKKSMFKVSFERDLVEFAV